MPDPVIIVDSGPLVAYLVEEDLHHEWAVARFRELPAPFLTCEPVLTETFHLVRRLKDGTARFFDLLDSGLLTADLNLLGEKDRLRKLVLKYRNVPMSLADACLVRMAEIHDRATILTVDGDFRIYRKHGRRSIPAILHG